MAHPMAAENQRFNDPEQRAMPMSVLEWRRVCMDIAGRLSAAQHGNWGRGRL